MRVVTYTIAEDVEVNAGELIKVEVRLEYPEKSLFLMSFSPGEGGRINGVDHSGNVLTREGRRDIYEALELRGLVPEETIHFGARVIEAAKRLLKAKVTVHEGEEKE